MALTRRDERGGPGTDSVRSPTQRKMDWMEVKASKEIDLYRQWRGSHPEMMYSA